MSGPTTPTPFDDLTRWARVLLARYAAVYDGLIPRGAGNAEILTRDMAAWLQGEGLPRERIDRARAHDAELAAVRALPERWPEHGALGMRLHRLFRHVLADDLERDLVALLVMLDLNPRISAAIRALSLWSDATGLERSFAMLVLDPLQEGRAQAIAERLRRGNTLVERGILRGLVDGDPLRPVFVDLPPIILTWLAEGAAEAASRTPGLTLVTPESALAPHDALPLVDHAIAMQILRAAAQGKPTRLFGPGVGDAELATLAAARPARQNVVTIDVRMLGPTLEHALQALGSALLLALLDGAWLLVRGLDKEGAPAFEPEPFVARLAAFQPMPILVEDTSPPDVSGLGTRITRAINGPQVSLPFPSEPQRKAIWSAALRGRDELAAAPQRLAPFPLGAAQMLDVLQHAQSLDTMLARSRDGVGHRVGRLAMRVDSATRWEDVVLPPNVLTVAREILNYAKNRHRVFADWGFAQKHAYGIGLAALFSGPPGTGKTMLAGIIAKELGLDLYKIDLSRIVSKYIGETEERLARLFDEAQKGGVALLFDEADSLFAKRTEVKSSVDRYANLEVNFLLQKMEEFSGVAFLTSNLAESIDEAFRRRIRFHARFPLPDAGEREALWRAMLPQSAPLAPSIDFAALARAYEFSGGEIKNASLRAAFMAVAENKLIDLEILDRSAQAESRERGRLVLRTAFDAR